MNIVISDNALAWFQEEMEAVSGEYIKFFARYGGSSPLHDGFSMGITKELPDETAAVSEIRGIRFYVEERDLWFFDGHDLHVDVDTARNELSFRYV